VRRNDVTDRVRTVLGDCRNVETTADRVVMGYYEAHEFLASALEAVVPGGVVHLHEATPTALFPDRPLARLRDAAAEEGRSVESLEIRRVKSHSAGVTHGVVDARIG
jgi:tRNA wybutosine-synthesizing protein 2